MTTSLLKQAEADSVLKPDQTPDVVKARGTVNKAAMDVQEARRAFDHARDLRRSQNALQQYEGQLAEPDAFRLVLQTEHDLKRVQSVYDGRRTEAVTRARVVYSARYKEVLRELDAAYATVVKANERVRAVWEEAYHNGVELPAHFNQRFLTKQQSPSTWYTGWRRALTEEGWL